MPSSSVTLLGTMLQFISFTFCYLSTFFCFLCALVSHSIQLTFFSFSLRFFTLKFINKSAVHKNNKNEQKQDTSHQTSPTHTLHILTPSSQPTPLPLTLYPLPPHPSPFTPPLSHVHTYVQLNSHPSADSSVPPPLLEIQADLRNNKVVFIPEVK